jgi:hypothetical protein
MNGQLTGNVGEEDSYILFQGTILECEPRQEHAVSISRSRSQETFLNSFLTTTEVGMFQSSIADLQ